MGYSAGMLTSGVDKISLSTLLGNFNLVVDVMSQNGSYQKGLEMAALIPKADEWATMTPHERRTYGAKQGIYAAYTLESAYMWKKQVGARDNVSNGETDDFVTGYVYNYVSNTGDYFHTYVDTDPRNKTKSGSTNEKISKTDMILAGSGTAGSISSYIAQQIMDSRAGYTSGKIFPNSAKIYNKFSATKVNLSFRLAGAGLTLYGFYNTESQYQMGEISSKRRAYNNLNNTVGLFYPVAGVPIAFGDYYGQKYSQQINNSWSKPGGIIYEPLNAFFNFFFPQK